MKKLITIVCFFSFSIKAQVISWNTTTVRSIVKTTSNSPIPVPDIVNFLENKELAKYMFNSVNEYRNSIKQESFIWEEHYYGTSVKWNNYLSSNSLWGHRNSNEIYGAGEGSELIVGLTLGGHPKITTDLYKMIADSCVMQWIHSPPHFAVLTSPIKTKDKNSAPIDWDGKGSMLNMILVKYGAISININRYKDFTVVQCIFHLGDEKE